MCDRFCRCSSVVEHSIRNRAVVSSTLIIGFVLLIWVGSVLTHRLSVCMLDLKRLRDNPDLVQQKLNSRNGSYDISPIVGLDRDRRELEQQRSALQARSNEVGKLVGQKMKSGAKPDDAEILALKEEGNQVKAKLAELEPREKGMIEAIETLILQLPNLPSDVTPIGKDETENVAMHSWGDEYKPSHTVLPHYEIAEKLNLLNTERATKVAQARFVVLMGAGAALERALIQYMLDSQIAAGYVEVLPPILINSASMTATGQLPKFSEESFKCADDDLWLAPTAEVPVTNLYRDDVIDGSALPIEHCAYTPCFRREAGSYGRDTRGLIRLHQFNKVELVKLVKPETSADEHQKLLRNAEMILEGLKLPYKTIELCTGDIGFGAARCFDIEVWLPSAGTYREISSCSNFGDFQARRGNIRFKEAGQKGTQFVHTLNGSGLAVGRTMAAVLENYQTADGQVRVPEVLQRYLGRDIL
jgi:seryl-tRNA synthetase